MWSVCDVRFADARIVEVGSRGLAAKIRGCIALHFVALGCIALHPSLWNSSTRQAAYLAKRYLTAGESLIFI